MMLGVAKMMNGEMRKVNHLRQSFSGQSDQIRLTRKRKTKRRRPSSSSQTNAPPAEDLV